MTVDEWLTCTGWDDWEAIWRHVPHHSRRALGLFGVACCRAVWHLLTDERSRRAIEVAERYAEGQASSDELVEARGWAYEARDATHIPAEAEAAATEHDFDVSAAHAAVAYLTERDFICVAEAGEFAPLAALDGPRHYEDRSPLPWVRKCNLLREVFGNPFRPLLPEPTWRTPAVLQLAQAAYDDRILPAGTLVADRLAVLADAVEEAGCTDSELLTHLRGPGPHVRGCWALDAALGRS
jgi:hypothetical protein